MHIYFSGVGGVGIGPLAHIALDGGYEVSGSDLTESALTRELTARGANVAIGQDGSHIATIHADQPIDWFVYTAALPQNHPELVFARENNIRSSKRDELLAEIIKQHNLKLIAVAGTHGKTTTTGMLVWVARQIGLPASYSIGTTVSFGPSGKLDPNSPYFFYECDEYDRNFLHFSPHLSLITSLDYDHPDIYKTETDYVQAFQQFLSQSENAVLWEEDAATIAMTDEGSSPAVSEWNILNEQDSLLQRIALPGHNRKNAALALTAISRITETTADEEGKWRALTEAINTFPGTGRRFEKLDDNIYSDYGHHPKEIASTLQLARELSDHIVLVYQPHQNSRQHQVKDDYRDAFTGAEKIYWLPTYLSREDPALPVLTPLDLISNLSNKDSAEPAEMDDNLWQVIRRAQSDGKLVLLMGAGSIDDWARRMLENQK